MPELNALAGVLLKYVVESTRAERRPSIASAAGSHRALSFSSRISSARVQVLNGADELALVDPLDVETSAHAPLDRAGQGGDAFAGSARYASRLRRRRIGAPNETSTRPETIARVEVEPDRDQRSSPGC